MKYPFVFALLSSIASLAFAQTSPDAATLSPWLKKHGMEPAEYVVSKFAANDIVMLGEDHCIKENLDFTASLIPMLYKAGVRNIVMEFGASEDQARMDSLTTAPRYSEQVARDMMFDYNVGWAYKEYINMPHHAWKFNKKLPTGAKKFRIINMSYIYDWTKFDGKRTPETMAKVMSKGPADDFRANLIANEIVAKGEKALILTGTPHAYTRFLPAVMKGLSDTVDHYDTTWLGTQLIRKFPGRIFNILLHQPLDGMKDGKWTVVAPANGVIEKAMERCRNKPMGFNLLGALPGDLRDNSLVAQGYPDFRLGQFFDGYVFLKPITEQTGCTIDTAFFNNKPWSVIQPQLPDPDWHGDLKSLDDHWKIIKKYADVKTRYEEVGKK